MGILDGSEVIYARYEEKTSRTKRHKKQAQVYDSTLKELIQLQAPAILPVLLPGAAYLETVDTERIRPTMRVDRVYKVMYRGQIHILHLEFESGADYNMASRLLAYHAILYHEYGIPVISIIIYLFNSPPIQPPFQEMSGDEALVTFHYLVLSLQELDAAHYVHEHIISMYPLLPAMQGVDEELLGKAMQELAEQYRNDEGTLSQMFVWMELLLWRTETVTLPEKLAIQRRLSMYSQLWEDHPKVKEIRTESKLEGKLEALRSAVVSVARARFPELAELAQKRVAQLNEPAALNLLLQQVSIAPDVDKARWVLDPYDA